MKFIEFFETAKLLLQDNYTDEVAFLVTDYCKLLEQFTFEHMCDLSDYQKKQVYGILLKFLQSLELEKFKTSCKNLSFQSKALILRNLDIISTTFPDCNLSEISKILV